MVGNQLTRLVYGGINGSFWQKYPILETLKSTAGTFIKNIDGEVQIWAASRDWFLEEWGRDTFISMPGILLVNRRFDEATRIFRRFSIYEKNGLIPNRIQDNKIEYNSVDSSMWFIQAVKSYFIISRNVDFCREMLNTLRKIIDAYLKGTIYERFGKKQIIKMDENDALIQSPAQATWMDADPSGTGKRIITPRNGKAVEINVLWYDNLRFLADMEKYEKNFHKAKDYNSLADEVKKYFNKKFWNATEKSLFDVIEGDPNGKAKRPNMIFAISHGGDLLNENRQIKVLESVKNELLTPGGLRTLSPKDTNYIGTYDTYLPIDCKDLAYHQGSAWPWLIGPFCDALAFVRLNQGKDEVSIKNEIVEVISPLIRFCMESPYKSLPELFSGDPPYEPGGTTSQAWSVSEVLRIIDKYNIIK